MSSTDRTLLGQGPCPCGEGQIAVYRCVPDHPWPTASVLNEHNLSGNSMVPRIPLRPMPLLAVATGRITNGFTLITLPTADARSLP
jgi:hypothetical protein